MAPILYAGGGGGEQPIGLGIMVPTSANPPSTPQGAARTPSPATPRLTLSREDDEEDENEQPASPLLLQMRNAPPTAHLLSPPPFLTPIQQIRRSRLPRNDRVPLTLGTKGGFRSSPASGSVLPRTIYTVDSSENPFARSVAGTSESGAGGDGAGAGAGEGGRWWDVEGILDSPERDEEARASPGAGAARGDLGWVERGMTDPTAAALSPRPGMLGPGPDPYHYIKPAPVPVPISTPTDPDLDANTRDDLGEIAAATPSTPLRHPSLLPSPSPSHAPGPAGHSTPSLSLGAIASTLAEDVAPVPNPLFVASIALSVVVGVLIVGMVSCSVAYCRRGKRKECGRRRRDRRRSGQGDDDEEQGDDRGIGSPERTLSIARSTPRSIDSRTFLRSSDTLTSFSLPPPSVMSMAIVESRSSTYAWPSPASRASLPGSIHGHPPASLPDPGTGPASEKQLSFADALETDLGESASGCSPLYQPETDTETDINTYTDSYTDMASLQVPRVHYLPSPSSLSAAPVPASPSRLSNCSFPALEPIDEEQDPECHQAYPQIPVEAFRPASPSDLHATTLAETAFHAPDVPYPRPASRRGSGYSARSSVSSVSSSSSSSSGSVPWGMDESDMSVESVSSGSVGSPQTPRPSRSVLGFTGYLDSPLPLSLTLHRDNTSGDVSPGSNKAGKETRRHTLFSAGSHSALGSLQTPPPSASAVRVRFAPIDEQWSCADSAKYHSGADSPYASEGREVDSPYRRPSSLPAIGHGHTGRSPDVAQQGMFRRAFQALSGSLVTTGSVVPTRSQAQFTSPPSSKAHSQRRQSAVYPARSPPLRHWDVSGPSYRARLSLGHMPGSPIPTGLASQSATERHFSTASWDFLASECFDAYPLSSGYANAGPALLVLSAGMGDQDVSGVDGVRGEGESGESADSDMGDYDEDDDAFSVNDARISFGFLSSDLAHSDCAFELAAFPEPASHLPHIHVTSH